MPGRKDPYRTRILSTRSGGTPLGDVLLSGFIRNSAGLDRMRVLGRYAVVLLLEGEGIYRDATGRVERVIAGDWVLLHPDLPHRYGPGHDQHWTEFHAIFDGPIFNVWRRQKLLDPTRPVWRELAPIEYWLSRWLACIEPEQPRPKHPAPAENADLSGLSRICLLQQVLADALATRTGSVEEAWLARARTAIDAASHTTDWSTIAASTGLSYEAFRKRFVRLAGVAPGRYRSICLMDRACAALQNESSIKAVADDLGFCDVFHFSRRFKQMIGLSPAEFQRQLRGRKTEAHA